MITPELIVITGPTATGKTLLGVKLAEALDSEVVSADSMQVYTHMDIGTAKPEKDEISNIPHHLISYISPFEDYSVARYVEDASNCIDKILSCGKTPVIVGGSGLYIDSLLKGQKFSARGNDDLRRTLEDEYDSIGGEAMLAKLQVFDEISAKKLYPNDKKRIVRAIEAFITTGKTISQHDLESRSQPPRYSALMVALTFYERSVLYERIDRRVDEMILKGFIKEVHSLLDMGVSRSSTALQAIGYKEFSAAILGEIDMETAVGQVKMESRRYAKRQLTWLRRNNEINWITWDKEPNFIAGVKVILEKLNEKK